MDQKSNNNETTPFQLPEVRVEDLGHTQAAPEVAANNVEENSMSKAVEGGTLGNSLSGAPTQSGQQSTFVDPSLFNATPTAPTQVSGKQIKVITDDLQAGDTDLIEKAWVIKAKAIVEKTKDDPYEQTNEIKKIKADYQRKRFNSNLKIDNE